MLKKLGTDKLTTLPLLHHKQSAIAQKDASNKDTSKSKPRTTNNLNLFKEAFQSDKTALMVTIGPTSESINTLVEMTRNGMNVIRINFSHRTHPQHQKAIQNIREAEKILGCKIPVMADLGGRKIRTGDIIGQEILLETGKTILLTTEKIIGDAVKIQIKDDNLNELPIGTKILLKDGIVELKTIEKTKDGIIAKIVRGGKITDYTGVHYTGLSYKGSALTEKDKKDLLFALKNRVDAVAISFVNSAKDILGVKQFLKEQGLDIPVAAKIETKEALENLDEILAVSDAVIIARGDMGVLIGVENVPVMQKVIMGKAKALGKAAIMATEMLLSMNSTRKICTRAEGTDSEYAVWDGAKGVLLAEETNTGKQPLESVKMMAKLIRTAERAMKYGDIFLKPELYGTRFIQEWLKK